MKKILPYLCVSFLFLPTLVSAEAKNMQSNNSNAPSLAYETCKKVALSHRDTIMLPALKQYRIESDEITNEAKNAFEKISWYINTSYKKNTKKILDEKKNAMLGVSAKITNARKTALATYQAETALCEMNRAQESASKSASVTTKNNTN